MEKEGDIEAEGGGRRGEEEEGKRGEGRDIEIKRGLEEERQLERSSL